MIVNGREEDGFDREDHDDQFSVHFTYVFNIFVFLQLFNFFNSRILDDSFNVFKDITKSSYFIVIVISIIILQILFLTFLGPAIRVVQWGLDPISWALCIVVGSFSLLISVLLKLIPLEKILPGSGNTPLSLDQLNKISTMNLRHKHDSNFYQKHSGLNKRSSVIEDKKI